MDRKAGERKQEKDNFYANQKWSNNNNFVFYTQLTSKMERTGKESLGKRKKEKATVLMWVTNTEGVTKKRER